MARYANGAYSQAICDRCGMQYDYTTLRKEWTGFRTCIECWEPKHPQLDPTYPPPEPQALYEPRPDRIEPMDVPVGISIFPPLQNDLIQGITQVGIVRVSIT